MKAPPEAPRFRGLRFQITVLYLGIFAPFEHLGNLGRSSFETVVHAGGHLPLPWEEMGDDVARIVEKQGSRWDFNCYDAVAGTGDGGGENEGSSGVHVFFERFNTGYVRKRCLPHISWRTSDMATKASDLDYQNLAAYFVEGITWTRLMGHSHTMPSRSWIGPLCNLLQSL